MARLLCWLGLHRWREVAADEMGDGLIGFWLAMSVRMGMTRVRDCTRCGNRRVV